MRFFLPMSRRPRWFTDHSRGHRIEHPRGRASTSVWQGGRGSCRRPLDPLGSTGTGKHFCSPVSSLAGDSFRHHIPSPHGLGDSAAPGGYALRCRQPRYVLTERGGTESLQLLFSGPEPLGISHLILYRQNAPGKSSVEEIDLVLPLLLRSAGPCQPAPSLQRSAAARRLCHPVRLAHLLM